MMKRLYPSLYLLLLLLVVFAGCSKSNSSNPAPMNTVAVTYKVIMQTPGTYHVTYASANNLEVIDEQFSGTTWSKTVSITKQPQTGYFFSDVAIGMPAANFISVTEVLNGTASIAEDGVTKSSESFGLTSDNYIYKLDYEYTGN